MKPGIVFILFISLLLSGCNLIDQFVQPKRTVVKYIVLPKEESGGSPTQIEASTTAAAQEAPLLVPTLTQLSDAQGETPSTAVESATPAPAATANPVVNQPANSVQNNQQAANIQPTSIPYNPTSAPQQVDNPTSAPQQVNNPTSIPNPTNVPNTAIPTSGPTETPIFYPVGISPSDLKSKLVTDKKFTCSDSVRKNDVDAISCDFSILVEMKSTQYHVEIYSKTADSVSLIYTVISQEVPDKQKSIDILGYIGSLPLGSNAAIASEMRAWIAGNINSATTTLNQTPNQFGGITYTIYSTSANTWFLEIGDPTI